ncbi:C40 family peptidase, partial [candidate division WOR-3 bacterium]|nr:C40 family peptidase [candidate division WOR-3 bacterium]
TTLLGEWDKGIGSGWGWQENEQDLDSLGTKRYRVYIKNRIENKVVQDVKTPRGIDMFRVSIKGDYDSTIVQWASSYLDVPFVMKVEGCPIPGTTLVYQPPYGRNQYYSAPWNDTTEKTRIIKGKHKGYEGLDCAGLAGWSYIWVGEDLDNDTTTSNVYDINNTSADMLEGYYGKDTLEMDDAVDGDMWFLDIPRHGHPADGVVDHVGIYVEIGGEDGVIHASSHAYPPYPSNDGDKVVKRTFRNSARIDHIHWERDWAGNVEDQAGVGRKPHNQ